MAEYIERKKAINALIGWETEPTDEEIIYTLKSIPAADVAPVVRCKDCKHRIGGNCYHEQWESDGVPCTDDNDFCSYGERRE